MYSIYFILFFLFLYLWVMLGWGGGWAVPGTRRERELVEKLDLDDPFAFVHVLLRAMSSPSNKEQFLKQFDSIVRGIVDNKERVRQDKIQKPNLFTSLTGWFIH